MVIDPVLQGKNAAGAGARRGLVQYLPVDLHAAVHGVDEGEQLALSADGRHRGAKLRLPMVGEEQVLEQGGFFLRHSGI